MGRVESVPRQKRAPRLFCPLPPASSSRDNCALDTSEDDVFALLNAYSLYLITDWPLVRGSMLACGYWSFSKPRALPRNLVVHTLNKN